MRYKDTELPVVLDVGQIISFHYFEYVKDFQGVGESHDFWEFVYVDYGEIWIQADEERILLCSQEGYLHRPGQYHNIYAAGVFASVFIFSFRSSSHSLRHLECRRHPVSHWGKDALAVLLRTGKEFLEGPYDDFGQEKLRWKPDVPETAGQLLKNRIENFLLLLLQESREDAQDTADRHYQESRGRETVEKVTGILSENLYGSLTLEQVAGQSALSQSYIEKIFKKHLGTTVMDYYHRLKIARARELISEEELTFTEIGDKLGYGSIHNFSRVFKKYTGMTPSGYQKTVQSKGLL